MGPRVTTAPVLPHLGDGLAVHVGELLVESVIDAGELPLLEGRAADPRVHAVGNRPDLPWRSEGVARPAGRARWRFVEGRRVANALGGCTPTYRRSAGATMNAA